jgi:hypothetical protein
VGFVSLASIYIYLKSRPSYVLYQALDELELARSQTFVQDASKETKYVLFKQLQGAGFNNQVGVAVGSWFISGLIFWHTGARDPSVPPSSLTQLTDLCLSASDLATSWRAFSCASICIFAWPYAGNDKRYRFPQSLPIE